MSGMSSKPGACSPPCVARIHSPWPSNSHQLPGVGLVSQPQRRSVNEAAAGVEAGAASAAMIFLWIRAEVADSWALAVPAAEVATGSVRTSRALACDGGAASGEQADAASRIAS